jgi:general secretion pathway protein E
VTSVEPFGPDIVRMRIDGILRAVPFQRCATAGRGLAYQDLAGLNIAERQLPQDGAARAPVGRTRSIFASPPCRHSTVSVVIRLLPRDEACSI